MSMQAGTRGLTKVQIGLMAVTAGLVVANIYYSQPILKNIAASLQLAEAQVGQIPLLTQVGYGLGLFFIVPLGDMINKKKLILALLGLLTILLLLLCFSNSLWLILSCSLLIGFISIVPQVVIPMAAELETENKGATVGIIYTGLLVGILGARVLSGFVASFLGWRYVYGISASLMVLLAFLLYTSLPSSKSSFKSSYSQLIKSTIYQLKRFPSLRKTALLGAIVFGVFSSFWTTLTFHLSGEPFFYGSEIIGLFGILAIAGALSAPLFGELADKGGARNSQLITLSLVLLSIVLLMFLPESVIALVVAVVLLDAGVQGTHVTNVAKIYSLDTSSLSRINTVYMSSYFLGGAIGTFFGIVFWNIGGWAIVTMQMFCWSAVALLLVLLTKRKR